MVERRPEENLRDRLRECFAAPARRKGSLCRRPVDMQSHGRPSQAPVAAAACCGVRAGMSGETPDDRDVGVGLQQVADECPAQVVRIAGRAARLLGSPFQLHHDGLRRHGARPALPTGRSTGPGAGPRTPAATARLAPAVNTVRSLLPLPSTMIAAVP